MELNELGGFVIFRPFLQETEQTGFICGEWAFDFPNGMSALVTRNSRGAGTYKLVGLNGNRDNRGIDTLPNNPLVSLTKDEVIDWLTHISNLGQNGQPSPLLRFPVAYFINKFRQISSDGWCEHNQEDQHGKKTALGWCDNPGSWIVEEEAVALCDVLGSNVHAMGINDGLDPRYQQPSPRDRVIQALRDILHQTNAARSRAHTRSMLNRANNQLNRVIEELGGSQDR